MNTRVYILSLSISLYFLALFLHSMQHITTEDEVLFAVSFSMFFASVVEYVYDARKDKK